MSTEEPGPQPDGSYVPSDPPTVADWHHLEERADANRRRGRRGVLLGIVAVVLIVTIGVLGGAIYFSQRDVPKVLDKVNTVVRGLRDAEADRQVNSEQQAVALAVIVEGIAGGFATAPYPDPTRLLAVQNLCQTAAQFRAAAHAPPVPCPITGAMG